MEKEHYRNHKVYKGNISYPIMLDKIVKIEEGIDLIESFTFFENRIYASSETYLVCYDALTKEIVWEKRDLCDENYAPVGIENGRLFAYINNHPSCLNSETGDILWQCEEEHYLLGASDNYLYCRESDTVICRGKHQGNEIWRLTTHGALNSVAAEDGIVLIDGFEGYHVCEEETGKVLWEERRDHFLNQYFNGKNYGLFAILGPLVNGVFYVGFEGGLLVAIDARTGELKWGYELEKPDQPDTIICKADKLFFDIDQGFLTRNYLTCLDIKTGKLISQTIENFSPFGGRSPILVGKYILEGCGQYLSFYDTEKLEFVYQFKHKKKINMFGSISHACEDRLITYNNASKELYWFKSKN